MNKATAIGLSILIFLTSLRDVITYMAFYLHQDFISQNLCKNRSKPKMKCHGKCVLNKSLAENHKKGEDKKNFPLQEDRFVYVLPNTEIKIPSLPLPNFKKDFITSISAFYLFDYLNDIFRPPSFFP
ncbi:MAG: hypothetical protein IPQ04_05190 [Saprospiraceae bacterium]|nr:hypothetical protein [Saprospiraceae bacterium]